MLVSLKTCPLLAVASLLLSSEALALTPAEMQEQTVLHARPQELFRDYALTTCLGAALPQVSSETSAAANGYIQYGEGPAEAYQAVGTAAREFLKRDYASQTGADLSIMKCIDFTHSRKLDALVARYFPAGKQD